MATEKLFEVPNLDDLSVSPQDYADAAEVFHWLHLYASRKAEAVCDNVYKQLPAWAKW